MQLTPRQKKQREARALKKASAPQSHMRLKHKILIPAGLDKFTDDDHLFWVAHGVNYMVSDFDKAVWSPLYEEIYEGKSVSITDLVSRLSTKLGISEDGQEYEDALTPEARAILAWTCQDKALIYTYSRVIEKAVAKGQSGEPNDPIIKETARRPKQTQVWEMFTKIRDMVNLPR